MPGALENQRWEKFCEHIICGDTQIAAYEAAFGNSSRGAAVNASKLMENEQVSGRLMELRKLALKDSGVLTLKEKRAFLRDVVKTPVGSLDANNPLVQSIKTKTRRDKDGSEIEEVTLEMPSKLRALELDARLAGELDSGAGAPSVLINIALLGRSLEEMPSCGTAVEPA